MVTKWYFELAQKNTWEKDIFSSAPSVIAYEYKSLYELLKNGAVYGAFIKVKDIFETILKFIVLVLLSEIMETEKEKADMSFQDKVFSLLMGKMPALGDWEKIGKAICEHNCPQSPLLEILEDVLFIYKTDRITNWRNVYLGHGALPDLERSELQKDLIEKIDIIHNHFRKNITNYNIISLELKFEDEYIVLVGAESARKLPYKSGNLFVKFFDKRIALIPFIQYIDYGVYFYDSYEYKTMQGHFLNYNEGYKRAWKDKILGDLYKKIETSLTRSRVKNASVEDTLLRESFVENMEKVKKPNNRFPLSFIQDELFHYIREEGKGIYLLQMEDGMGKTTFVKMMDQLQHNKKAFGDNVICRAVYINAFYANTVKTIIRNLKKVLQKLPEGDFIDGDLPEISENSSRMSSEFHAYICEILEYYEDNYFADKIVLFFDGIDELPYSSKNLVNLFSHKEKIPDGIYIIITSRMNYQLSSFTKKLLSEIDFDHLMSYNHEHEEYRKLICNILSQKLGINNEIAEELRNSFQGKFINLELAIHAYEQYGDDILSVKSNSMNNWFFENAQRLYGEYYFALIRICLVLSLVPVPISLKTLSCLLGERSISFELLFNIYILSPVLQIEHTDEDTMIGIGRAEVRAIAFRNEILKDEIIREWIHNLNDIAEDEILLDEEFHLWLMKLAALDINQWDHFEKKGYFFDYLTNIKNISLSSSEYEAVKSIYSKLSMYFGRVHDKLLKYIILNSMAHISIFLQLFYDVNYAIEKLEKGIYVLEKDKRRTPKQSSLLSYVYARITDLYSESGKLAKYKKYKKKYELLSKNGENNYLTKETALDPGIYMEAKALRSQGKDQDAIKLIKAAKGKLASLKIDSTKRKLTEATYNDMLALYYEQVNPLETLNHFLMANNAYEELVNNAGSEYAETMLNACMRYLILGRALHKIGLEMGFLEKALEFYKTIIEPMISEAEDNNERIDPNDLSNAWLDIGDIEFELGYFAEAVPYYTKVINIYDTLKNNREFPNYTCRVALERRGIAYSKLGEDEKAQKDINDRIKRFSEPIESFNSDEWEKLAHRLLQ